MNYKIATPLAIYELGKRDNQEDALYPPMGKATDADRTFIVCDGMGGHEKGEVASNAVCDAFARNIDSLKEFSPEALAEVLRKAYDALDDANDSRTKKKMGTTLTFLNLHSHGATIAHIGDSRVYFISPSRRFIWHTRDHSLVQAFLEANLITADEVKNHPQRNIITRVMQPAADRAAATIDTISDLCPGDFFFLCSDGMTEELEDCDFLKIFSDDTLSDEQIRDLLIKLTKNNSDNHTAYIVRIEDCDIDNSDWQFTSDDDIFEINPPVVPVETALPKKKESWWSRLFKF